MSRVKKYLEFIKEQEKSTIGYNSGSSGYPTGIKSDPDLGSDNKPKYNYDKEPEELESVKLSNKEIILDDVLEMLHNGLSIDKSIILLGDSKKIIEILEPEEIKYILVHSKDDLENNQGGGKIFIVENFLKEQIDPKILDTFLIYTVK